MSAVLVECGETAVLLDCGEGTVRHMLRFADRMTVDAIFVSHNALALPGVREGRRPVARTALAFHLPEKP